MWPFSTVTDPKRRRYDSARSASSVVEPHEVGPSIVEALPAAPAHRALAITREVLLATVEEDVVLPRQIEHALGPDPLEDLGDRLEGARLLTVGLIAGVQDEGGRGVERVDPLDDLLQRRRRVLVGFALEAHVRVADLHEAEATRRRLCRRRGQRARR